MAFRCPSSGFASERSAANKAAFKPIENVANFHFTPNSNIFSTIESPDFCQSQGYYQMCLKTAPSIAQKMLLIAIFEISNIFPTFADSTLSCFVLLGTQVRTISAIEYNSRENDWHNEGNPGERILEKQSGHEKDGRDARLSVFVCCHAVMLSYLIWKLCSLTCSTWTSKSRRSLLCMCGLLHSTSCVTSLP